MREQLESEESTVSTKPFNRSSSLPQTRLLLLIESDRSVMRFLCKGLEANSYSVKTVSTGRHGLTAGLEQRYGLIILDVMLPDMDGYEVCRQLRGQGIQTPLLMLSSEHSVQNIVQAFELGADDYLAKPFAFEVLVARIHALLRRQGTMHLASTLEVADLVLDEKTHEVTRAGRPLYLTPTEFNLLAYLMQHVGQVLSRPMIESQVWGSGHDSLTNSVDVYIRRLRRKIDHGRPHPLIHTVRGIGYMFKA